MKCCSCCFGDRGLQRNIFPAIAIEQGKCDFCESENVPIVPPVELMEHFSLLLSIYKPTEEGTSISQLLRNDWALFQHPKMDDARVKSLLAEILDDGEIVRKNFIPSNLYNTDSLIRWEEFRTELMYKNRFFPETNIDMDRLEELLSRLIPDSSELPTTWFRARIQTNDIPFNIDEMGAPPQRVASHGRANPAGIPYLYLASTDTTAISEIRPHTGEFVSVAEFTTPNDLNVVDLRQPRKMLSPFLLSDAQEVGLMRGDAEFLERLGEELTRPVLPRSAAIDYTPSQYLCEFIKKQKYDGVIYRSSVSDGINLALFNLGKAGIGAVTKYYVTKVAVSATQ